MPANPTVASTLSAMAEMIDFGILISPELIASGAVQSADSTASERASPLGNSGDVKRGAVEWGDAA